MIPTLLSMAGELSPTRNGGGFRNAPPPLPGGGSSKKERKREREREREREGGRERERRRAALYDRFARPRTRDVTFYRPMA